MAQRFRPVIEVEGLPPLKNCLRLRITQAIFDHHQFEIVVPHEALEGPDTDGYLHEAHHKLCGKRVTISLAPIVAKEKAPDFHFSGIITQLRLGSSNDLSNVYIIEGYSPTYLLEDSAQRRTFVKQTLPAICQKVLSEYGGNPLKSRVMPRNKSIIPYAVQYDEDNFAFLKRLAATYGEWLYYTGTELVIGPPTEAAPVPFVVGGAQSFSLTLSLRPSKFKAQEYDYRQHQTMAASSAEQTASGLSTLNEFALAKSEALFPQAFHVGPAQAIRQPSHLSAALGQLKTNLAGSLVVFEGVGETPGVTLGGCLAVQKPATESSGPAADLGQYRVLSIEHWLDDAGNYLNQFRAVPASTGGAAPGPWLVPPPAGALELAAVIDVADPKRLGRIRVRYPWPVARPADAESGWLRVSTPYAGDGKGHLFTPEVGSQVLVGYEQQRAEQPVVLGNLFHALNPQGAKYTTPQNQLKGLQTAGGNKFVMSDTKGAQTILISNSNNKGTAVEVGFQGDGSITIKSNGPVTVLSPTITLEAGDKGEIKLHAKTITVEAEEEFTLSSKSKSISLQAKQNILADATEKMELTAKTASLTGRERAGVLSPETVDVGQGATVNVSASIINQS